MNLKNLTKVADNNASLKDRLSLLLDGTDIIDGVELEVSAEELGISEFNDSIVNQIEEIVEEHFSEYVDESDEFDGEGPQFEVELIDPHKVLINAWYNV